MSTQFDSSPGFNSDVGAAIALGVTLGGALAASLAAALAAVDGAAAWLALAGADTAAPPPVHAVASRPIAAISDSPLIRRPIKMSSSLRRASPGPGLSSARRKAHLYHGSSR